MREGELSVSVGHQISPQPRVVYLFNDMMLLCARRLLQESLECKDTLRLDKLSVRDPGGGMFFKLCVALEVRL